MVRGMPRTIDVAVGVVVELRNGEPRVLLQLREDGGIGAGKWECGGGKWQESETLPETVVREYREEQRVRVVCEREPFALKTYTGDDGDTICLHFFETTLLGHPTPIAAKALGWFNEEDFISFDARGALMTGDHLAAKEILTLMRRRR